MATIKDTLVLEDRMSQTIRAVQVALDHASASTKIAQHEMEQMKKTYGETSIECANATMKWSKQAEAVEKLEGKLEKLNNKSNKSTAFMVALGNIGANIAMRAFDGLKNSIGQAIETASNLVEVQNVVDVAFKENSKVVDEWSKNTLNKFGLNELSAKKFAGTMGAMLNSAGLAGDKVVEMSTGIAGLAGDMASFYNLNPEEAFMKLRSGISGETEPLKQLGINMSVANLEAFALTQGITKAFNKMSQAEQMTLRYNYLMKATADAQGDFARTSNTFANQQKLLNENWLRLSSTIATYILPALASMFKIANNLINFFIDRVIPTLEVIVPILAGIATGILIYHIPALVLLGKQYVLAGTKAMIAGIKMATAWLIGLGPIGLIIAGVGGLIGLMVVLVNKCKPVADVFYKITNAIDGAFTAFKKWRNRNDEKMVSKIEADYQARVQARADKVANIGTNKASKSNLLENALNKFSTGGALKTKQQGSIELKEEDIKMLNELASRDFMVRYQSLSPQVNFGNVTVNENADFGQLIGELSASVDELANNSMKVGVGK